MGSQPEPFNPFDTPTPQFLQDLFGKMPVAVIRLTPEGVILALNPEAESLTGYMSNQIIGRNFWATMFPGKLFQQVPKFISNSKMAQTIRNQQMTLRRRDASECTLLLSRFLHQAEENRKELVIVAIDPPAELKAVATTQIEEALPPDPKPGEESPVIASASVPVGEFVTPIAASPKKLWDKESYRQGLRDAAERVRRTDRAFELFNQAADETINDMIEAMKHREDPKIDEKLPPDVLHQAERMQLEIHDLLALCRRVCH